MDTDFRKGADTFAAPAANTVSAPRTVQVTGKARRPDILFRPFDHENFDGQVGGDQFEAVLVKLVNQFLPQCLNSWRDGTPFFVSLKLISQKLEMVISRTASRVHHWLLKNKFNTPGHGRERVVPKLKPALHLEIVLTFEDMGLQFGGIFYLQQQCIGLANIGSACEAKLPLDLLLQCFCVVS